MSNLLPHDVLLKLHAAVVSGGLTHARDALLSAIDPRVVAALPLAPTPSHQVLLDLSQLNGMTLADGSVPLRTWLGSAAVLVGPRVEARVFQQALAALDGVAVTPAGQPAAAAPSRQRTTVDAVCLTALGLEHRAVVGFLDDLTEATLETGTIAEIGMLPSPQRAIRVAVIQSGQGNNAAAATTQEVIAHFKPKMVLMVGVAGGLKDVRIGDVVAATKVYGYESGKASDEFLPRPDVGSSSYRLVQRAMHESLRSGWLKRLGMDSSTPNPPTAHVGPIAAGSAVIASTRAPLHQFLRRQYSDALAVEMEGRGFTEATYRHRSDALVVRGISDLIDGKQAADSSGSQPMAARNAAAFALNIIEKALP
jgi:nucleoside phosphorylase